MAHALLSILWFAAPLWAVNVSLNVLGFLSLRFPRVRSFDRAIDGRGDFFDGRRVLGDSTTLLGFVVCIMLGALALTLTGEWWYAAASLLVYAGHALGSFIKRRLGYADGTYLPLVDHLDYMVLAGVCALLIGYASFMTVFGAFTLTFFLTPLVTILAYVLSLRQQPL